jgi:hypothetical protein
MLATNLIPAPGEYACLPGRSAEKHPEIESGMRFYGRINHCCKWHAFIEWLIEWLIELSGQ